MGYGQRAMEILEKYYEGSIPSLSEEATETKQEAEVVDSKVNQKCSLGKKSFFDDSQQHCQNHHYKVTI